MVTRDACSVLRHHALMTTHSMDAMLARWNMLQSRDIAQNQLDLTKLAWEFAELEKFVLYLAAKAALGQPLEPNDPVLRQVVKVGPGEDLRAALVELVAQLQHRASPRIVKCPKCGAGVKDLRGVTEEKCQFCGAVVRTHD